MRASVARELCQLVEVRQLVGVTRAVEHDEFGVDTSMQRVRNMLRNGAIPVTVAIIRWQAADASSRNAPLARFVRVTSAPGRSANNAGERRPPGISSTQNSTSGSCGADAML